MIICNFRYYNELMPDKYEGNLDGFLVVITSIAYAPVPVTSEDLWKVNDDYSVIVPHSDSLILGNSYVIRETESGKVSFDIVNANHITREVMERFSKSYGVLKFEKTNFGEGTKYSSPFPTVTITGHYIVDHLPTLTQILEETQHGRSIYTYKFADSDTPKLTIPGISDEIFVGNTYYVYSREAHFESIPASLEYPWHDMTDLKLCLAYRGA